MKIWKIVSGALSIAISLFVAYQSFFAGLLDIITSSGQTSGTAGIIVSILLLTGGIVSIASSGGSMGADIALISLYGVAALVGFTMAGSYTDLMIWALWCILCAVLALVDFIISYQDDDDYYEDYSTHTVTSGPPTLRSVVMEPNQKKREAAIDALPEKEAKSYLKQVITAFINREPINPPGIDDDRPAMKTAATVVLTLVGVLMAGLIVFAAFHFLGGGGKDPAKDGAPSAAVSLEPSAEPSAEVSDHAPSGSASPSAALGDYDVEIKSAVITRDSQGNQAILITYSWTNNSQETTNALTAFIERAFQNGVQIDMATILSSNPQYTPGTSLRDLRPGASTDVQCAYLLADTDAPVEFEVLEFLGSSDAKAAMTFDLETLPTVE